MDQSTDLQQIFIPPPDTSAERGYQLTVVMRDGEPWFVARDVAGLLGLGDPRSSLRTLDDDERGEHTMPSPSGEQRYNIINESGLYSLILRSRRPEARTFKKWVTSEVLPSIRKTGGYSVQPALPQSLPEALRAYALEVEARELAQVRAAELEGPARAHGELMSADGTYSLAEAAQTLGMGRDKFIELLAEYNMIIVRRGHSDHLRPYESARRDGRMALKVRTFEQEHRDGRVTTETDTTARVTPKGLEYVRKRRNAS